LAVRQPERFRRLYGWACRPCRAGEYEAPVECTALTSVRRLRIPSSWASRGSEGPRHRRSISAVSPEPLKIRL
ncbi:uncharacterized protein METZ01_LOCUS100499, partial [marine metagenome]